MVFVVYFVFVRVFPGRLNSPELIHLVVVFPNQQHLLLYIPLKISNERLVQPMLLHQFYQNYHLMLIDIIDQIHKTKEFR
jgi:hypothetical protein